MTDEYDNTMGAHEDQIMQYIGDYERFVEKMDCNTTREDIVRVMELVDMRLTQLIDEALEDQLRLDRKHPTMDLHEITKRLDQSNRLQSLKRGRCRDIRLKLIDKIMENGKKCEYPGGWPEKGKVHRETSFNPHVR